MRHIVIREHPQPRHARHDLPPQREALQHEAVLRGVVVRQARAPAGERRRVPVQRAVKSSTITQYSMLVQKEDMVDSTLLDIFCTAPYVVT